MGRFQKISWCAFGLVAGIFISSCGGAPSFNFHYYPFDFGGKKLVGATPADDLDYSICKASSNVRYPCMVMLEAEFFRLKADDLKAHSDLDSCQRGRPPTQ